MSEFLHRNSLLAKLVTLICLLLAVAWLARNPDWEPAIAVITLFALLVLEEFVNRKAKFAEVDRNLFQVLLSTVPSNGSVEFLRDHDMGVSFDWNSLSDLRKFDREWNDPEHEFHDKKVEKERKQLYEAISRFLVFTSLNTFPNTQNDRQSVPKEWQRDQAERYTQTVAELNKLADEVVTTHQMLVRTGRKRLHL